MDDTMNINNQQEGGEAKRWHFDVSNIGGKQGTVEPEKKEEKAEEPKKEEIRAERTEDKKEQQEESATKGKRTVRGLLKNITSKGLRRYVPWIFMVVMCFVVLIFNRYRLEDLVKEKNDTEERIKYLREHRIQMQKIYQESTKISKIAEELDTLGIGLLSGPPYEMK
ncbi:MAG: hypothetical protein J5526_08930 [Bacteroidales bacterium]|nr:hypothetical protein [Bacteroidales bacterium]